ncbi:protoheme IX farnesyltransferase [Buchnera aphidicola (Thelaxes californica)]|uniref:Protoheme IX farnesyltransferase n=1 Tax=Buchnera aphidicola (Thelaxes californica) TaxID=1315998 RepID=A0A4D6YBY8_9GAMM|nr:heme o synthase [Buchnera aphidicola]QCI26879.1 protoheme IX farnesyltransferase [Buchnera aphidicola (Thelaxes californica)]
MNLINIIKKYINIIKPGILLGNLISFLGGIFFAFHGHIFFTKLYLSSIGTILVIASGCIFNNIIDRDIDKTVQRTKNRVLAKKLIKLKYVYFFAFFCGIIGFLILFLYTNFLVFFNGMCGFLIYVIVYTLCMKRFVPYATLIGSISGAMPILMGYCTINSQIDLICIILFLILIFWQIAHFYSISIFRIKDYQKNNIPIFSVIRGIFLTQILIIINIFLFIIFTISLYFLEYTGIIYFSIIIFFNVIWLFITILSIFHTKIFLFSRISFIFSIIIIFLFNIMIGIDYIH